MLKTSNFQELFGNNLRLKVKFIRSKKLVFEEIYHEKAKREENCPPPQSVN